MVTFQLILQATTQLAPRICILVVFV